MQLSVTPEEVLDELVKACPSFAPGWRAHLRTWYPNDIPGQEKDRIPYVDVGGLSRQVVGAVTSGNVAELPAFFSTLETLYRDAQPARLVAVIVETLAGKRTYYAYVVSDGHARHVFEDVKARFPEHELSLDVRADARWDLYDEYRRLFPW